VPPHLDAISSSERYPYLIDRHLQIYANDNLYLNVPFQMKTLIFDSLEIIKYRKRTTSGNPMVIARQVVIDYFNSVLSLVVQGCCMEAVTMIGMLNDALKGECYLGKRQELVPTSILLGRKKL
jgi:hypothetical protein